ncbi:hypothetical protein AMECASPLE_026307 [Ameca splendens]|uniref:Uncharacterized protein n=1 Tax=Ameca splendens TaxID=208324 RepID=A0ABV0XU27_9TELE
MDLCFHLSSVSPSAPLGPLRLLRHQGSTSPHQASPSIFLHLSEMPPYGRVQFKLARLSTSFKIQSLWVILASAMR